jgi:hypothetical protein
MISDCFCYFFTRAHWSLRIFTLPLGGRVAYTLPRPRLRGRGRALRPGRAGIPMSRPGEIASLTTGERTKTIVQDEILWAVHLVTVRPVLLVLLVQQALVHRWVNHH